MEGMVAGGLSVAFAFACAAMLGAWASSAVLGGVRRARRSPQGRRDALRRLAALAMPVARALRGRGRVAGFANDLREMLNERGIAMSAEESLSLLLVAAAAAGTLAGLIAVSPVATVAAAVLVIVLAAARARSRAEKRRDALRDAVPDALHAMGACFQAGFSLLQTFQQLAHEMRGPLRKRFASASNRLETGQPISAAIDELRGGDASSELAFVAVALDVQHEAGGSMRPVLEAARDTVEGELELRRSLKVQTAQARLSARVVTVMPFVLIALFSLISDGFLTPFFTSLAGIGLLSLALLMEVAGVLMVRRMLAVEVS